MNHQKFLISSRLACACTALLALAVAYGPVQGQQQPLIYSVEAESLFQRGLARYIQGNYAESLQVYQQLLETTPPNQRTSAAMLMSAKSRYKLGNYSLAYATAIDLYDRFPYSRYLPEADLVVADCYFHQNQIYSAAAQYARILTGKGSLDLKTRAADRLGQLGGSRRLSDRDQDRLKADFGNVLIDEAVAFGAARWPLKLGKPDEARRRLIRFLERYPNSPFAAVARQSLMRQTGPGKEPSATPRPSAGTGSSGKVSETSKTPVLSEPSNPSYKVGVIAPLETKPGKDLRNGILLAREAHALSSGEQVGLVFEDSEGDPIRAVRAANRLIEQHNVIAIIGALHSDETIPLATLASALKVPLIAPTASEDGIATLSPYVFQINATPGAQGRRIADYAVRRLGLRTLATLGSRDSYGNRVAREFTTRAEELGAEVVIQEGFATGTTDYRRQFERIRGAGLALEMPEEFSVRIDSIIQGDVFVELAPPEPVDLDTVQTKPVTTLDGLLVAAQYGDDIGLIAPQVAFSRVETQVLGSDGWNYPQVASENQGRYVNGTIFVAKYYDQSDLPSVQTFVTAYRNRFREDQNIVSALGHDAMLAVMKTLEAGGTTRDIFRQKLADIEGVWGAAGQIDFLPGTRENGWMYLLKIQRGRIHPILDADLMDDEETAIPIPDGG